MNAGKCFEEFKRGEKWISRPRRVTQRQIDAFARISKDRNPIHLDPVFARTTLFKRTIAHGLLGLSIASGMLDELGILRRTILAFVGLNWQFLAPIFPGDRIRLEIRVLRKRKSHKKDRGIVALRARLFNQEGCPVQAGDWTLLVHRKGRPSGRKISEG